MAKLNQTDDLLSTCGPFVDEAILVCAIRSRKFWKEYCAGRINTLKEDSKYEKFNDFIKPAHNLLYNTANQCHTAFNDTQEEIPEIILLNVLDSYLKAGQITDDDFTAAIRSADTFWHPDINQLVIVASSMFLQWFELRRTQQLATRIQSTKSVVTVSDVLAQLRGITKAASGLTKTSKAPTALQALQAAQENPVVLTTYPMPSLGDFGIPLGGGIVPGELGLIITPPNGGKTVLANQMAADLSLSKRNVVLVTTEQSANQMYWRQYSNIGNIDFTKLALGYDPKKFTEKENARITEYCTRVDPYLRISDWSQDPGTIELRLEPMLQEYVDEGFQPEIVLFDWLGGGLSNMDEHKLRDHMIAVARVLRQTCRAFGAGCVLFSQANANLVEKVTFVGPAHIDNCKMLHTFADWGCGISALADKDRDKSVEGTGKAQIAKRQCFNFFKTRNALQNFFWYERDFKYQRWRQESGTTFYRDPLGAKA